MKLRSVGGGQKNAGKGWFVAFICGILNSEVLKFECLE